MDELKACPFCGGEALYHWRGARYGLIGFVKCEVCDAQTRCVAIRGNSHDAGFEEQPAFKKLTILWNKRA